METLRQQLKRVRIATVLLGTLALLAGCYSGLLWEDVRLALGGSGISQHVVRAFTGPYSAIGIAALEDRVFLIGTQGVYELPDNASSMDAAVFHAYATGIDRTPLSRYGKAEDSLRWFVLRDTANNRRLLINQTGTKVYVLSLPGAAGTVGDCKQEAVLSVSSTDIVSFALIGQVLYEFVIVSDKYRLFPIWAAGSAPTGTSFDLTETSWGERPDAVCIQGSTLSGIAVTASSYVDAQRKRAVDVHFGSANLGASLANATDMNYALSDTRTSIQVPSTVTTGNGMTGLQATAHGLMASSASLVLVVHPDKSTVDWIPRSDYSKQLFAMSDTAVYGLVYSDTTWVVQYDY